MQFFAEDLHCDCESFAYGIDLGPYSPSRIKLIRRSKLMLGEYERLVDLSLILDLI